MREVLTRAAAERDAALRAVAALVSAALRYGHPGMEEELYPAALRLGLGPDATPETAERALKEILGLRSCRCTIDDAPGDPAGTLTDLRSGEPRTVFRDGDCLVIPALRLDAEGCRLLRTIVSNEMPGLSVNHGPACTCTPCLAEPSYRARREAARAAGAEG